MRAGRPAAPRRHGKQVKVSIRAPPVRAGRPAAAWLSGDWRLFQSAPRPCGRGDIASQVSSYILGRFNPRPARAGGATGSGPNDGTVFESFQSAPRPCGRGDCGPVLRLSHKGFIALFRQPANPSRPRGYSVVKERLQVSMPQAVVPRREIPVAGPALGVRGVAFITPTAHSGPTAYPHRGARSVAPPFRPGNRSAASLRPL